MKMESAAGGPAALSEEELATCEVAVGLEDVLGLGCPGIEQRLDLVGMTRQVLVVSVGVDEMRRELGDVLVVLGDRGVVVDGRPGRLLEEALVAGVVRQELGQI